MGEAEQIEPQVVAVVDDDDAARISVVRLLEVAGYTARGFDSGSDFLAAADVTALSCVVSDLQMPGVTGLELQKALHARGVQVPMVFVTGFNMVSSMRTLRALMASSM